MLQDPLDEITNPDSSDFVAEGVTTLLHEKGTGPQVFSIDRPEGVERIRFYVSCTPDSEYTLTMGLFFAGPCAPRFLNNGGIPVPSEGSQFEVDLDIPAGIDYWIVAIPTTL